MDLIMSCYLCRPCLGLEVYIYSLVIFSVEFELDPLSLSLLVVDDEQSEALLVSWL